MRKGRDRILSAVLACFLAWGLTPSLFGQEKRIVTPDEVKRVTLPAWLLPLRIISYPHRAVSSGMEHGLIAVEKRYLRQRWQRYLDDLRRRGIVPVFGGTGEGTGLGGGLTFLAGQEKSS